MQLHDLYIVKETFKAGGELFLAGKVLTETEAHQIRLFKVRVNEGKIVPLRKYNQDQLKNLVRWIQVRYGVDARANIKERLSKGSESADKGSASASTPPGTTTPTKVVAAAAPKSGTTKRVKTTVKTVNTQTQK